MQLDSINAEFEKQRGPRGYPSGMRYRVMEKAVGNFELCIEHAGQKNKKDPVLGMADSWGFAAFVETKKKLNDLPLGLRFAMPVPSEENKPKCEALKRRLSYLAGVNKEIPVVLFIGDQEERLYTMPELDKRPANEVVHEDFVQRGDKDKPGRLEKDFQTYLFGKGLYKDDNKEVRTNERLALFGQDFCFNKDSQRKFGVEREFPTGVFIGGIKAANKKLPTEYIDLVSVNKHKEIAIIELKFNDASLEVIAQLLNYALFFHSYKAQLTPLLDKHLNCHCTNFGIKAYLASNVFHQRFTDVWRYYSRGPIAMRQIIMGFMPDN